MSDVCQSSRFFPFVLSHPSHSLSARTQPSVVSSLRRFPTNVPHPAGVREGWGTRFPFELSRPPSVATSQQLDVFPFELVPSDSRLGRHQPTRSHEFGCSQSLRRFLASMSPTLREYPKNGAPASSLLISNWVSSLRRFFPPSLRRSVASPQISLESRGRS